jgi:hypothetical protein
VTDRATITDAFFSYQPASDLPAGRSTATLIARDTAGNETRREWSFTLAAAETLLRNVSVTPPIRRLPWATR